MHVAGHPTPTDKCAFVSCPQAAALCGVHALNALLQGPYFTEVELAQVGWCASQALCPHLVHWPS
jgi:hypothetical protein